MALLAQVIVEYCVQTTCFKYLDKWMGRKLS